MHNDHAYKTILADVLLHSMIGNWHNPVVCPSICLTLCIVALRVGVRGNLYQHVPSRHVPICPFKHFCCSMYCLATKRVEENTSVSFFGHKRPCVMWFIAHYLLLRT